MVKRRPLLWRVSIGHLWLENASECYSRSCIHGRSHTYENYGESLYNVCGSYIQSMREFG